MRLKAGGPSLPELPLLVRQFTRSEKHLAGSTGLLYAINAARAATGCALTGFVLIPALGMSASILFGAGLNLLAGLLILARFGTVSLPPSKAAGVDGPRPAGAHGKADHARRTFLLFFLMGFVALGFEVLWTRFLGLLLPNTVYTYTLTLSVVLAALAMSGDYHGALQHFDLAATLDPGLLSAAENARKLRAQLNINEPGPVPGSFDGLVDPGRSQ